MGDVRRSRSGAISESQKQKKINKNPSGLPRLRGSLAMTERAQWLLSNLLLQICSLASLSFPLATSPIKGLRPVRQGSSPCRHGLRTNVPSLVSPTASQYGKTSLRVWFTYTATRSSRLSAYFTHLCLRSFRLLRRSTAQPRSG